MEDNNHKILLTVIGAGTLLVALAGATFAYFSATNTTETQTVTTSIVDLSVETDTNTNHVENIKPTTWDENDMTKNIDNKDIAKVSFKVTSDSTAGGTYNIDLTAPGLALKEEGTDAAGNPIELIGGSLNDVKYKLYSFDGENYTAVDGAEGTLVNPETAKTIINEKAIDSTTISENGDRYVIFVYIENSDDDQNQLQGVSFDVVVEGSASQLVD